MSTLKYLPLTFCYMLAVLCLDACCSCFQAEIPATEAEYVSRTNITLFEQPIWSPDGKSLALKEFKYPEAKEHTRLFLYTFDNEQLNSIPNTLGDYRTVSWSPDSTKLVVARLDDRGAGIDIQVIDLSTATVATIGRGKGAAWAPNGQSIAIYVGPRMNRELSQFVINLVQPDGTLIKPVTLPITPTPSSDGDTFDSLSWSPDSQQIVLSISHWPVNHHATSTLYLINVDTTEFHQLTTEDTNLQPVWSPDGNMIAFIKQNPASLSGKIYLLWPSKNCSTPLSETIVAKSLSWSPDGSRIAYENATKVYLFDVAKKLASGNLVGKACQ